MKFIFALLLTVIFTQFTSAQTLLKSNEQNLFSFETVNKKEVSIVKRLSDNKIFYRFGSEGSVAFQYPTSESDASQKLIYSFYLRGGGQSNEGMDLNYINFIVDSIRYVIYDIYYSADNTEKIGVRVIDLKTNKSKDIHGIAKTKKGTLIDFRDNNLLEISEEIFD